MFLISNNGSWYSTFANLIWVTKFAINKIFLSKFIFQIGKSKHYVLTVPLTFRTLGSLEQELFKGSSDAKYANVPESSALWTLTIEGPITVFHRLWRVQWPVLQIQYFFLYFQLRWECHIWWYFNRKILYNQSSILD